MKKSGQYFSVIADKYIEQNNLFGWYQEVFHRIKEMLWQTFSGIDHAQEDLNNLLEDIDNIKDIRDATIFLFRFCDNFLDICSEWFEEGISSKIGREINYLCKFVNNKINPIIKSNILNSYIDNSIKNFQKEVSAKKYANLTEMVDFHRQKFGEIKDLIGQSNYFSFLENIPNNKKKIIVQDFKDLETWLNNYWREILAYD